MNAVIIFFDPNEKQSVICDKAMERMRAVESGSVKSARKAKDKLHKACERASGIRERTLQRQAHGKHESHETVIDSSQQVQLHALLRRGFGTSVPFVLTA